jgi:hypothetical protein
VAERFHQPSQCHRVLASEQIRRRQECALTAGIGHQREGKGSHGRLARADVTLEQPHHWLRACQIGHDCLHRRGLVRCEVGELVVAGPRADLLGQCRLDARDRLVHTIALHVNRLAHRFASPPIPGHHSDFETEEFVKPKPA